MLLYRFDQDDRLHRPATTGNSNDNANDDDDDDGAQSRTHLKFYRLFGHCHRGFHFAVTVYFDYCKMIAVQMHTPEKLVQSLAHSHF